MSAFDDTHIATLDYHHRMLSDERRVQSFLKAILATVKPGDVVVDIGTGTGILALFSAMAGAEHVYAIEQEPIIEIARAIVERNGYGDRVTFIAGSSTEVELPERANVLVTETVGNAGFDEGITRWTRDATERLLAPSARLIPDRIDLVGALVHMPWDYQYIDRWAAPLLTFDVTPLREASMNNPHWVELTPAHEISDRVTLVSTELGGATNLAGSATFTAATDTTVHGLGVWFDVRLAEGIWVSNAPPNRVPSWEQGLLPIARPIEVAAGETMSADLAIDDDGASWSWRVADSAPMSTRRGRLSG